MLVKIHGVFVPLTELTQIPKNTVIDALHGTLSLTTAAGGPSPARDAAAKGKKPKHQDSERHVQRRGLQAQPGHQTAPARASSR